VEERAAREDVTFEVEGRLAEAVAELLRSLESEWPTTGPERGVFRVAGHCRSGTEKVSWSVILKIRPERASRSEFYAYQSGILDDLRDDLQMPICYRIDEQENGSYWLWLEDAQDDIGVVWPVERFGLAARHLGHFNGQCLVGKPLLQAEWFGRKPTLQWDATERVLAQLESVRDHLLVARAYTPENARGVRRLWEDRHTLLAALETLPTTLCHLDAQR